MTDIAPPPAEEEAPTCPVCYEDKRNDCGVVKPRCGHEICVACYIAVTTQNAFDGRRCPICRTTYRPDLITEAERQQLQRELRSAQEEMETAERDLQRHREAVRLAEERVVRIRPRLTELTERARTLNIAAQPPPVAPQQRAPLPLPQPDAHPRMVALGIAHALEAIHAAVPQGHEVAAQAMALAQEARQLAAPPAQPVAAAHGVRRHHHATQEFDTRCPGCRHYYRSADHEVFARTAELDGVRVRRLRCSGCIVAPNFRQ